MNTNDETKKTILFASIINRSQIGKCLRELKTEYNVFNNNVYILNNKSDRSKLILTFNINNESGEKINFDQSATLKNTINIHRNKDTNTLYTINALNLITEKTNSKVINWEDYHNSLLVIKNDNGVKSLAIIHTSLNNIANLDKVRVDHERGNTYATR